MNESDDQPFDTSANTNRRRLLEAVATLGNRKHVVASAKRRLRVLLIDDDPDTVEAFSLLAGLWGHDVQKAISAQEGLVIAAAYRPDLLLVDVGMPVMDGCQMARLVRLDSRLQGCFIVAITGHGDEEQRRRCCEAGIDLLLVKPVDASLLKSLLALETDYVNRTPQ